jgi:hypothetical protein
MITTGTATQTEIHRCAAPKCGRILRNAKSIKRGFGPTCYRRIQGQITAIALTVKPKQMDAAKQIIIQQDIKIIDITTMTFEVVSSDRSMNYYTSVFEGTCTCPAYVRCKHMIAGQILALVA